MLRASLSETSGYNAVLVMYFDLLVLYMLHIIAIL